jgi:glycosyltransferase involved in cell wall biosynthesis
VHYIRFPVQSNDCKEYNKEANSIIFIGRCTEAKGYHLLPSIAKVLLSKNISLQWHIVGELKNQEEIAYPWHPDVNVVFHGVIENEDVKFLLCRTKLFILPSIAEGMPMALIEAMKAGTIPIVNNLEGGIQEVVKHCDTGYLIDDNNAESYVNAIEESLKDNNKSKAISENCILIANDLFNPFRSTMMYEEIFLSKLAGNSNLKKKKKKGYKSRLDKSLLPNWLVTFLRTYISKK